MPVCCWRAVLIQCCEYCDICWTLDLFSWLLWGQMKGAYGGALLLSPWLWGAPKTVVHLGISSNMSAFSRCYFLVYAHHLILFELQPRGRLFKARFVLAEMCCKSECRLGLRRAGLVESSIWEGSARHSPCLPCASALLCTLCCCCMRWTPKREWNGRFGAQVTEKLSFRVRPPCRVSVDDFYKV